jgi:peptidoglycan/LPS O-acetylase OafA/YrhL
MLLTDEGGRRVIARMPWRAWPVWRTRQDEFIPLLVRVDWRTLLLLTGVQVLGSLLLWSLADAAPGAPGGLQLPACLLGRASLSFFLGWSLYGLVLGRSVHVFTRQTPWTLLFLYAATLAASLLLAWFFFRFFERFPRSSRPGGP